MIQPYLAFFDMIISFRSIQSQCQFFYISLRGCRSKKRQKSLFIQRFMIKNNVLWRPAVVPQVEVPNSNKLSRQLFRQSSRLRCRVSEVRAPTVTCVTRLSQRVEMTLVRSLYSGDPDVIRKCGLTRYEAQGLAGAIRPTSSRVHVYTCTGGALWRPAVAPQVEVLNSNKLSRQLFRKSCRLRCRGSEVRAPTVTFVTRLSKRIEMTLVRSLYSVNYMKMPLQFTADKQCDRCSFE